MAADDERHELISAAEAAKSLGTTPLSILMHIKRGLLSGKEFDGAWQVTAESLAAFQREQKGDKAQLCRSGCAAKTGGCKSCG